MDLLGILRIKDINGNWVNVPGLKGDTGEPFKILGIYATAAALEAAVTDPGIGDVYLVGTAGAYDIYLYLADGWHNTGRYMPKGDTGDPAPAASITSAVEAWLAANVDPETGYVLDRTLTQENAAAPADLVGDLKSDLTILENMEKAEKRTYITDFVYGRIEPSGSITAATYIAYSPTMFSKSDAIYFDTSRFRAMVAYYNNETDTTPRSVSGWKTASPIEHLSTSGGSFCKIMIANPTNAGTVNIDTIEQTTYKYEETYSDLVKATLDAKNRLTTIYVSTSGNDANNGSATAPLATIQEAINRDAENIIVEEGTYERFSVSSKTHPVRIAIKDFSGTNKKIKIESQNTDPGVSISNCTEVTLSDIWVDGVPRHCFAVSNSKNVKFIRCIASNNETAAFMGFYVENANTFFDNCEAYNMSQDGFNFHYNGTSILVNCVAHDCSDDGVSHHENCNGTIIGGEFYGCGKGGIASPTYGAEINIYNAYSHDNNYGLFAEGLVDQPIKSKVSGCVFKDNTSYDLYANYGEVIGWNNIYSTIRNPNDAYTEITNN